MATIGSADREATADQVPNTPATWEYSSRVIWRKLYYGFAPASYKECFRRRAARNAQHRAFGTVGTRGEREEGYG